MVTLQAGQDTSLTIVAFSAKGDVPPTEVNLLLRAVELLVRAEPQTNETRVLEMTMRGQASMRLPFNHEFIAEGGPRIAELAAFGMKITSPQALLGIGMGRFFPALADLGYTADGCLN